MLKNSVKRAFGALSLSAAMALGGAFAGDAPDSLRDWAKAAGQEVDNTMTYPGFVQRARSEGHAVLHVTIDSDGDVLKSEFVTRPSDPKIRSLAKGVVRRADFPAIPANLGKEKMKFALDLTYTIEGSSFHKKMQELREGRVTGSPVASSGTDTLTAGITILKDAD